MEQVSIFDSARIRPLPLTPEEELFLTEESGAAFQEHQDRILGNHPCTALVPQGKAVYVSTCTEIAPYVPDEFQARLEAESLQSAVDKLRKEKVEIELGFNTMDAYVNTELSALGAQMIAVRAQLQLLRAEQGESTYSKDSEEEHRPDATPADHARCKALYRKLALLCHPDRTKDERLLELWEQARRSNLRGDWEHLDMLLHSAKEIKKSNSLIGRLIALRLATAKAAADVQYLKSQNQYMIYEKLWLTGNRQHVVSIMQDDRVKQIMAMRQEIANLQRQRELKQEQSGT